MPGLTLGDHAIPILLILKMSVLRKAIFFTMEAGFKFALITENRSEVLHGVCPFCEMLFLISNSSIADKSAFVIQLVVKSFNSLNNPKHVIL